MPQTFYNIPGGGLHLRGRCALPDSVPDVFDTLYSNCPTDHQIIQHECFSLFRTVYMILIGDNEPVNQTATN